MTRRIQSLPYHQDSADLFEHIRHEPWPVFLDSGFPMVEQGRYDILTSSPYMTLVTRGGETEICEHGKRWSSTSDPLVLLREALAPDTSEPVDDLPFTGGALGYFSYDLARQWERLPTLNPATDEPAEMAIGLYDWALIVDHHEQASWLVSEGRDEQTAGRWASLVKTLSRAEPVSRGEFQLTRPIQSALTRERYAAQFAAIQRYIRDGDCYQVNFAQRFQGRVRGDLWQAYRQLRLTNPAPFSAFYETPFLSILSSSPERFLHLRQGQVQTRPIKGTSRRSSDTETDKRLRDELRSSAKDLAENLMIVDLLRNDLGRVCRPGSVQVPQLFEIESFARVHHMVSTVEGQLETGRDALDLLRACFPGGSITGAPKLRAMEIIEELEDCRRGIYCGSIGYIGFDGGMDTNIVIRTITVRDGNLEFWAGGGIVSDSKEAAEYQETLDKSSAIFEAFAMQDSEG
ncbi:MAG: aminodeoxychorismate synthase component I [Candidatus Thiodiazotropha sp. (ex Gloverina cf. vestifex)]|nr:aminodeoxychorismate synthase component I [Candidatus Thiodiazotropha sp. (ex Gloverina cf. vestifex)]